MEKIEPKEEEICRVHYENYNLCAKSFDINSFISEKERNAAIDIKCKVYNL